MPKTSPALTNTCRGGDLWDAPLHGLRSPDLELELRLRGCHSLQLPRAQHLDRQNWKWVIDDMVDELGATWLTEEDRQLILEYLFSEHGPRE